MGILQRLLGRDTPADPVAMAQRIGACLTPLWHAMERGVDNEAAVAALEELNRQVRQFIDVRGTTELNAAVSVWAAQVATGNQSLIIAAYFADRDNMDSLVKLFGVEGATGLIYFQEGLNEAGLTMSPSYLDRIEERVKGATPAPAEPIVALAEVVWPVLESETKLRLTLAEATGLSENTVAWELFAVRDTGFEVGSTTALADMAKQDILERKVHAVVEQRLRDVPVLTNFRDWAGDRRQRYAEALRNLEGEALNVAKVKWLDAVRRTFQACLGTDNHVVGQVGAAEYDRALNRSMEICAGFNVAAPEQDLPIVWGKRA